MTLAKAKKVGTADKDRMHFRLDPDIKARVARAAAITGQGLDRKSTRLNSSHVRISYAVFCLKKKKTIQKLRQIRTADRTFCLPGKAAILSDTMGDLETEYLLVDVNDMIQYSKYFDVSHSVHE